MKHEEKQLAYVLAEYLSLQYPFVIYRFDVGADIRLTIGQATTIKDKLRHKRGFPDLMIFEARHGFHGLFIELKKDRDEVYKKDGGMRESKHIREQWEMLKKLRLKGYSAVFGCGFEDCRKSIDWYLGGKK